MELLGGKPPKMPLLLPHIQRGIALVYIWTFVLEAGD